MSESLAQLIDSPPRLAVVGVPNDTKGTVPVAFVTPRDGVPPDEVPAALDAATSAGPNSVRGGARA